MRTETAPVVRLEDYRPSDFLIDRVELDVRLHPTATGSPRRSRAAEPGRARASAAGARRRRADPEGPRPRRARSCRRGVRGGAAGADDRAAAAPAVHADDRDRDRPDGEHQADGALPLGRQLLHAMRGGRLPPHHLFPRPARRAVRLHDPHRGRPRRGAGAARQRQPGRERRRRRHGRHFAVWHDPAPQAVLSVRAGRRRSRPGGQDLHDHDRAARSSSASMSSTARRTAPPMRWTR